MAVVINGTNGIQNPLGSAAAPASTNTTNTNTGLYYPTGTTLGLSTNGSNAMYIDASQNVGIGTTSPAYKLDVSGNIQVRNASYPSFQLYNSGLASNPYYRIAYDAANNLVFNYVNSAYTSSTEQMRIDSSGNVGIGTSSPTGKIHAYVASGGISTITNSNGTTVSDYAQVLSKAGTITTEVTTYGSGLSYVFSNASSAMNIGSTGAAYVAFFSNNTERMRIDSSGNLLVGTTSTVLGGAKLSLATATSGFGATVSAGAGAGIGLDLQRTATNGDICYFRSPTGLAGYITVTGTICTYNSISDERLKTNIVASESAIPKVLAMQVRNFDWKDGSGKVPFGFIAQELATVAPEAVTVGRDKEDGSLETPWALDSSVLVPYLVKAIQELSAEVTALKAKVGA